jgi:hypothetical protein
VPEECEAVESSLLDECWPLAAWEEEPEECETPLLASHDESEACEELEWALSEEPYDAARDMPWSPDIAEEWPEEESETRLWEPPPPYELMWAEPHEADMTPAGS